MPPAARITDMHTCPMSTGPVPHVGGPILPPGAPTVMINFLPAATVTSMAVCVGPPDIIVKGSAGVFINYLPSARMGDQTAHGGVIVLGSPNVIIGETGSPSPSSGFAAVQTVLAGLATAGVSKAHTTPPPVVATVTEVSGTLAGTHGLRTVNAHKQRATNHLKASSSASDDLAGNAPVILVRGCKEVKLTAKTSPPNALVTWEIKPNQNTNDAPSLVSSGRTTAILETDKTGSFSVTAISGDSKVVWNVVFVSVEVDTASTVPVARRNYVPRVVGGAQLPGSVSSGNFVKGQDTWESTVTVNLVGGGADGKMGIDKVKLRVLQNGVVDTLDGNYAGPPAGSVIHERVRGGFPVVDSNGSADVEPTLTMASSVSVTPATGPQRKVWTGDSPAGGFPLQRSAPALGGKLISITGINGFKTAVASFSTDARTEYMVHADIHWQAHFDGTINAAGIYTANGAHTVTNWTYKLISPGTGGLDAAKAGYETFDPRFNNDTFFDPAP